MFSQFISFTLLGKQHICCHDEWCMEVIECMTMEAFVMYVCSPAELKSLLGLASLRTKAGKKAWRSDAANVSTQEDMSSLFGHLIL